MGPLDRRLLRETPAIRRFLVGACILAALSAVLVIVWAELIGRVVTRVFLEGGDLASISALLGLLVAIAALRA